MSFFPENRADCEIMLRNVVEPDKPQMASNAIYMADK